MLKHYEQIFHHNDEEVPSEIFEDVEPLMIDSPDEESSDDENNPDTEKTEDTEEEAITSRGKSGSDVGSNVGSVFGTVGGFILDNAGYGALTYWLYKRGAAKAAISAVKSSSSISGNVSSTLVKNPTFVKGITKGAAKKSSKGIISKLLGKLGGTKKIISTGTKGKGLFKTAMGAMKGKITALLSSTGFWVGVVVGVAVFITLYLLGDADMKEITQLWKSGKFTKDPKHPTVKNVYKGAASGLVSAKVVGLKFLETLNKQVEDKGKFTIRLKDEEKIVENNAENYLKLYKVLEKELQDVPLIEEVFAGQDIQPWVNEIEDQYSGLNVSARREIDNYDILKAYVTKYKLEDADESSNPYGVAVAEEADGWYSTFFDNFIPGMNDLGWASWMVSDEYLNNINSIVPLKSRDWLYQAVNSYWIAKVKNLNASSFTTEQFALMSEHVLKNGFLKDKVDLLNNLEYGVMDEDGKYTRMGSFQHLLKEAGKYNTQNLLKTARSDKKVPVTNVTLSFSLMYSTYSLLYLIYEGLVIQLTLLQVALGVGDAERKVLEEYKVKDEYETGERIDSKGREKEESTSSSTETQEKVTQEEIKQSAKDVIETFKSLPGLDKFDG